MGHIGAGGLSHCNTPFTRVSIAPSKKQMRIAVRLYHMQMSPLIAVHMSAALGALVLGPVAIWARKGAVLRPRVHRAFGYGFVTLMLGASASGVFIRDYQLPNIAGYTPIHLLIPVTLLGLFNGFHALYRGDIERHRRGMLSLYLCACVTAGAFTLLPSRYLGQLVWGQWLGLL